MTAKVISARLKPWTAHLPEPAPARMSRVHSRRGVEIEVTLEDGRTGKGDISPLVGLHTESLEESVAGVESTFHYVRGLDVPAVGTEGLHHLMPTREIADVIDTRLRLLPASSWGLTCALLDAAGVFDRTPATSSAVLMADDLDIVEAQVVPAQRAGAAKAKVPRNLEGAIARMQMIREKVGDVVELRFDCGQAFSLDDARKLSAAAAEINCAFLEEPVGSLEDNFALASEGPTPVALDESLVDFFALTDGELRADVLEQLHALEVPTMVTFGMKPAWLGAAKTRALISIARTAGIPIVISSVYEPPFARAQLAQLQRAVDSRSIAGLAIGWELDCTYAARSIELVK